MSFWINGETRVLVQGITGRAAQYHTTQMLAYGTKVVGGVTPGKGGTLALGLPVFDTVQRAVQETAPDASVIFVPAPYAPDAIIEAAEAGISLIVCITEHIPVQDMIKVKNHLRQLDCRLIGPNCPGLIVPGQIKIGIMPGDIHKPGRVGIVSRSGTLTYEAVAALTRAGIGQSAAVGIGGDPIKGTDFIDVMAAFEDDEDTDAVVMIGEIGGNAEEGASEWIRANMSKPVIGFISGKSAPAGKRMGHAGAMIAGGSGTAASKLTAMNNAGIAVAESLLEIPQLLRESLK